MELSDKDAEQAHRMLYHDKVFDVPGAKEAHLWWHGHEGTPNDSSGALLDLDTPYVQSLKVRLIAWKLEGK